MLLHYVDRLYPRTDRGDGYQTVAVDVKRKHHDLLTRPIALFCLALTTLSIFAIVSRHLRETERLPLTGNALKKKKKGRNKKLAKWSLVVVFCVMLIAFVAPFSEKALATYPESLSPCWWPSRQGGRWTCVTAPWPLWPKSTSVSPSWSRTRGGGGGTVALAVIANAKPDGYTICGATSTGIVRIPQFRKVPFKPLKSFTPIMAYGFPQSALVVRKDAPWKTFKEFIEYAKTHRGRIKYNTTGVGTPIHLAMKCIAKREGIKWVHIPYKKGALRP